MRVFDSSFDRDNRYDLLIATCGYERRSSYVCRLGVRATEQVAVIHGSVVGGSFTENARQYMESGWLQSDLDDALSKLRSTLSRKRDARIAIDISSMPRGAIAALVECLHGGGAEQPVHFLYVPGDFLASKRAALRSEILSAGPVSQYFAGALRPPSTPIGLIVGLGLEPHRTLGVVELLEPSRTWAFVGHGSDLRFEGELDNTQRTLGSVVDDASTFHYDLHSVASTYSALESLVFSVGMDHRIIMAPSGPKVFTLACLLVAAGRDKGRPAVWRVGDASAGSPVDVEEVGEVVLTPVTFASTSA